MERWKVIAQPLPAWDTAQLTLGPPSPTAVRQPRLYPGKPVRWWGPARSLGVVPVCLSEILTGKAPEHWDVAVEAALGQAAPSGLRVFAFLATGRLGRIRRNPGVFKHFL